VGAVVAILTLLGLALDLPELADGVSLHFKPGLAVRVRWVGALIANADRIFVKIAVAVVVLAVTHFIGWVLA
jgi:hypothetical protein